jgi:hypothetical protein
MAAKKVDVRAGVDPRLLHFADEHHLHITAGKNGRHNKNSKHYIGEAIDFRTRGMSDAEFQEIAHAAHEAGLILRDERHRPEGQVVWSGQHGHLELP